MTSEEKHKIEKAIKLLNASNDYEGDKLEGYLIGIKKALKVIEDIEPTIYGETSLIMMLDNLCYYYEKSREFFSKDSSKYELKYHSLRAEILELCGFEKEKHYK